MPRLANLPQPLQRLGQVLVEPDRLRISYCGDKLFLTKGARAQGLYGLENGSYQPGLDFPGFRLGNGAEFMSNYDPSSGQGENWLKVNFSRV